MILITLSSYDTNNYIRSALVDTKKNLGFTIDVYFSHKCTVTHTDTQVLNKNFTTQHIDAQWCILSSSYLHHYFEFITKLMLQLLNVP